MSRLAGQIHNSPTTAVVAVTGAGGRALAWLLGAPGASRTVLEAIVPYSAASLTEFLGHAPRDAVSAETAAAMAQAAYARAVLLHAGAEPVVGLACTATIATDRPKRGEHRLWVATFDGVCCRGYGLTLAKGRRDRDGEEDVVSRVVLRALAEACAVPLDLPLELFDGEQLQVVELPATLAGSP